MKKKKAIHEQYDEYQYDEDEIWEKYMREHQEEEQEMKRELKKRVKKRYRK
ncbi:hypothetical protein [Thermodesulfovibrio sp. TK110]